MARLVFFAFFLVFAFPSLSFAQGSVNVGDAIPGDLSAKDQNEKMRSFEDIKGAKGITLVFIRSADWCPHCQKQLIDLNKNAKKFSQAGYPVVTVSYDLPEKLNKFASQHGAGITMLSDPASKIIRDFGILNENSAKGTFSYGIPHPGVYIVAKNKKVQAKIFKEDYTQRPSAGEILAEIEKLNPPEVPPESMDEDPIVPGEETISIPEKIVDPVAPPEETVAPPPPALPDPNVPSEAVPEAPVVELEPDPAGLEPPVQPVSPPDAF